jgi:PAS domain S-box-containing protein
MLIRWIRVSLTMKETPGRPIVSRETGNDTPRRGNWLEALVGILTLAGLYAISRYNFLLFHCLTEAFSIVIAIAVFGIFWNTRQYFQNGAYLIIGFGCLFAGILDLIYIFAYKGMSVFPGADGNIALQAKTAAQWFVSLSCVGAFPFLRRKINEKLALCVYLGLLALALGTIFYWRVFPDCYREGVGQTAFQRIGLVISCTAYLAAIVLLARNRREFDGYVFKLLATTLTAFFLQDFASALATDIEGFGKTVAHLCQVVALYFVYKAFVEVGLRKPYDLLFRKQQQSAEALQIIFDSVPACIFYKDKENRFLRVNRAFADMMGMPREQLEGRSIFDLYPREQAEAFWKDDQDVIASGKPKTNIVEPVQIKTEERWVQTDKVPYRDPQGHIIGVIGFSVEITERRRAEEAIRQSEEERHRAELAHVARLTMMGEMAASLVHELNQPLHAVSNYARGSIRRLLKMPDRDEDLVAAIRQIDDEAKRAAEIVRRVRRFVQKREPQSTEVLLNHLVEEVVLLSKAELEQRHIRIVLRLAENLPPIPGDPIQIEQVIMNLVRNGLEAMDDMPEDRRILEIRTARNGDDAVQAEVCDCGMGIEESDPERVFQPFFTTKPEGMGMGLAISRSIIEAHGGRLWSSANEVQGCTFHFTLPIVRRD